MTIILRWRNVENLYQEILLQSMKVSIINVIFSWDWYISPMENKNIYDCSLHDVYRIDNNLFSFYLNSASHNFALLQSSFTVSKDK